jgi:hypothetical protein
MVLWVGTHHLRIAKTLAGRYEWPMAREDADTGELLDPLNAAAAWRLKPEIARRPSRRSFSDCEPPCGEGLLMQPGSRSGPGRDGAGGKDLGDAWRVTHR